MQSLFYSASIRELTILDHITKNVTKLQNINTINTADVEGNKSMVYMVYDTGSSLIAFFPVNNSNFYFINPNDINISAPESSVNYTNLIWKFDINSLSLTSSALLTGSQCIIYDNGTSQYYVSQSKISNDGGVSLIVGDNYLLGTFSSGSYSSSLVINDITSGSIVFSGSGSSSITSSFVPLQFHKYEATFSIIDPILP